MTGYLPSQKAWNSPRYRAGCERVFLTGTQALVRVVLEQARRDRAAGRNTAGFLKT